MNHSPGQVYRRFDRPGAQLVVLSSAESNRAIGWVTVCPYMLTGKVGNLPNAERLHSIVPAPGYIAWTIHYSVLANTLTELLGEVETAPLVAARFALAGHFGY